MSRKELAELWRQYLAEEYPPTDNPWVRRSPPEFLDFMRWVSKVEEEYESIKKTDKEQPNDQDH